MRIEQIQQRLAFADFLERHSKGEPLLHDWQQFVVTHYPDEFLEEMRRCTVRLRQNSLSYHADSEPAREALRYWAFAIRSSCQPDSLADIVRNKEAN